MEQSVGRIVLPNRSLTCDNLCVGHTDKKPTLGSSHQRIRLGQEAHRRPRVGQRSKERTSGSLSGLEITFFLFFCRPNLTPSPHLLCAASACPHVTKCPPQSEFFITAQTSGITQISPIVFRRYLIHIAIVPRASRGITRLPAIRILFTFLLEPRYRRIFFSPGHPTPK